MESGVTLLVEDSFQTGRMEPYNEYQYGKTRQVIDAVTHHYIYSLV